MSYNQPTLKNAGESAMIKSLLEQDDDLIDEVKFETEAEKPNDADENEAESIQAIYEATIGDDLPFAEAAQSIDYAPPLSKISDDAVNYQSLDEASNYESPDKAFDFNLPDNSKSAETQSETVNETFYQPPDEPESTAQTVRRSGLAYAAAITLFGSVVFLLIIGWGADLLLGTSPWGIVGGIALGAIIGFFQFFRITSQIFKK